MSVESIAARPLLNEKVYLAAQKVSFYHCSDDKRTESTGLVFNSKYLMFSQLGEKELAALELTSDGLAATLRTF